MEKRYFIILLFIFSISSSCSQQNAKKYTIRTIAFYNLENLFDTINDVSKNDEASPIMELKWNKSFVYNDKIEKLSSTIAKIGKEESKTSPAIIGVAEVENTNVLRDLINSKHLKAFDYGIIHYDSPDKRGIDVALLYRKQYFKPVFDEVYNPNIYSDNKKVYTRDQLLVSGYLDDEMVHIIVNHWPSRRGGSANSSPLREKAAYQNLKIIAKIRDKDKHAKIFIMGDFNDDPTNKSFKEVLQTKHQKRTVKEFDLYNPYENMFRRGFNTLVYRDNINLFDQILISGNLLDTGKKEYSSFKMYKANIFNKQFLTHQKGKYKGYPFRSFSNGNYTGGYSDHYPVYMYIIKEKIMN
ncbi:endonuclease/exonuclease/phosphatase family protein [Polaribacter tangerinus]|uniref:endonuclease/exonuclease/phosphatase family protein n=1 Tax=Polaribacter tangerinus TaxID=1920034 RepID=UPI000B4C05B9|nr:endonuclease/exonuclease/phosphatase family protein [Polaribacter tangerinus]